MYFCDAGNRLPKEISPGVFTRTFWANNMLASLIELSPNSVVPLHAHPQEQVGTVLEGELHMTIAGETRLIKAGEAYVKPGHVEHGAKAGEKSAKVFDVFSPVREDYKY